MTAHPRSLPVRRPPAGSGRTARVLGRQIAGLLQTATSLALLTGLSGCLSVASQLSYATGGADGMLDHRAVVYGGSRAWFGTLRRGDGPFDGHMWDRQPIRQSLLVLFLVVDLPLCLVADTVLLPVTLLEHGLAGAPAADTGPAPAR